MHPTSFSFQEGFKNLLLHGDAWNTQFITRRWGWRSRTEPPKQVLSLSAVTWALQPTQTPHPSPVGGHPHICQVHLGAWYQVWVFWHWGPAFQAKLVDAGAHQGYICLHFWSDWVFRVAGSYSNWSLSCLSLVVSRGKQSFFHFCRENSSVLQLQLSWVSLKQIEIGRIDKRRED